MTECEVMIDRMPLVAHGRDAWTSEEEAHLATCPECGPAWRLIQTAARLGADSAVRIDTAQMAVRVLRGVNVQRRRDRWRKAAWIGLSAAAAAMTLVVSVGRREAPAPDRTVAPHSVRRSSPPISTSLPSVTCPSRGHTRCLSSVASSVTVTAESSSRQTVSRESG
jgi:anti-sigma factor RsiW